MSYRFLEDVAIADVAYEVEAASLSDLFAEAAEALLKVQIENLESIRRKERRVIDFSGGEPETLLHQFLQELVFWKDSEQLLFLPESVDVKQLEGRWRFHAVVSGEPLDPERHSQGADVKAVTWHRFSVTRTPQGWRATIVLDI